MAVQQAAAAPFCACNASLGIQNDGAPTDAQALEFARDRFVSSIARAQQVTTNGLPSRKIGYSPISQLTEAPSPEGEPALTRVAPPPAEEDTDYAVRAGGWAMCAPEVSDTRSEIIRKWHCRRIVTLGHLRNKAPLPPFQKAGCSSCQCRLGLCHHKQGQLLGERQALVRRRHQRLLRGPVRSLHHRASGHHAPGGLAPVGRFEGYCLRQAR